MTDLIILFSCYESSKISGANDAESKGVDVFSWLRRIVEQDLTASLYYL